MLENIAAGFLNLWSWQNILFINFGIVIGIVFGALPGLTATMGVALFLPITFGMEPIMGMLLLLGIYCGGIYGGSISAILIKTPGTPASAATILDGYPMMQNGHAGKALDIALVASTIAGLFSAFILLFMAPQVARAALKFGPPEFFTLALFGLSIIATISSKQVFKGLLSGCIGMFISSIGLDPIEGLPRFTFGITGLLSGISLIPALIGLFAITEILNKVYMGDVDAKERLIIPKERMSFGELKASITDILKSSAIGTVIGAIPGTGATTASFLSYMEARRSSKTPEKFGTGHVNGIAAAEAGNNGVTGATLIPLLTLGIPGDSVTAVMLGALMMQGLTPGPALFQRQGVLVYTIMVGLIFVNLFMLLQGKLFLQSFVNVTRIPTHLLSAILIVLCVVGGFSVNNSVFEVIIMLIFAFMGYMMLKVNIPVVPMLLAIILGPIAEESMRQSLILSQGSYSIFITRPISLAFLILTTTSILVTVYLSIKRAKDMGEVKKVPV